MSRPRCTTVLRRFLDGGSIATICDWLRVEREMKALEAHVYVEHCIRRGLRGEVRIPRLRRRRSKR